MENGAAVPQVAQIHGAEVRAEYDETAGQTRVHVTSRGVPVGRLHHFWEAIISHRCA